MSELKEIMKRVRQLDIRARKLVRESFSGEYRSGFRGQGLDFDDFREYQAGDEPRFIDWNVTARTGQTHIRQFCEERESSVILAVDLSASMEYGSKHISKARLAAEVAALVGFSALRNGDKLGLLLFAGKPLSFIPPAKGRGHGMRVIKAILETSSEGLEATNFEALSRYLVQHLRRRSLVFLLSDFLADDFDKPLGALAHRHELLALHLLDPLECELPDVGRVTLRDPETGDLADVNTSNANLRMAFQKLSARQREGVVAWCRRHGVDYALLSTVGDYLPALHSLMRGRASQGKGH